VSDGIYSALGGALAQVRHLDTLANNLANMETTGFKRDRLTFAEILSDVRPMETTIQSPGAYLPSRLLPDDKRFVQTQVPVASFEQGPLIETGNTLDCALGTEGFFAVETAQGPRYTRDGGFVVDALGRLTTKDGIPVRAVGGGEVFVNPGELSVDDTGTVFVDGEDVGQIEVVALDNPKKQGHALFSGAAVPLEIGAYEVRSGFLEGSNVNPIRAMTQLIAVHRTFEVLQNTVSAYRKMDGQAANEVGRPSEG